MEELRLDMGLAELESLQLRDQIGFSDEPNLGLLIMPNGMLKMLPHALQGTCRTYRAQGQYRRNIRDGAAEDGMESGSGWWDCWSMGRQMLGLTY